MRDGSRPTDKVETKNWGEGGFCVWGLLINLRYFCCFRWNLGHFCAF